MNIDAYDDEIAWQQQQQPQNQYIPGYDPDADPTYHVGGKPHYQADLYVASQNYWAGKTGRDQPPVPSYREIHGRQKLGRYVDEYAAQAWLRWATHEWRSKLWFFIFVVGGVLFLGGETGAALGAADLVLGALLMGGVWLHYRRYYVKYYRIQQQVLYSGEPVWVPYERKRLKLIRQSPCYLWP